MKLEEVGIVIGKKLTVRRIGISRIPIVVSFEGTEIRKGGLLVSSYGEGTSVIEAKKDYCKKISGQVLVINAYTDGRKEIRLPKGITI